MFCPQFTNATGQRRKSFTTKKACKETDMKPTCAFCVLFLLVLSVNGIDGRRGPEEYWKQVMKDQPMPEAIKGLLVDQNLGYPSEKKDQGARFWTHFKRDFDTTRNAIIYQHHHGFDPSQSKKKGEIILNGV